jgi:hypothetical protein
LKYFLSALEYTSREVVSLYGREYNVVYQTIKILTQCGKM